MNPVTTSGSQSGTAGKRVYTVSRLNQDVQQLLEKGFGTLWLQAELSNLARPASGHLYFSLKDSQAQIRCAMFKGRARYLDRRPENGDVVLVRGKLGLYTARGEYQLIVEHLEPAGAGQLQARFDATRKHLDDLGWFDVAHKRALPAMPASIGVVTSPSGAAIRDVLQVLARRYPQGRVIIYPTRVQGQGSDLEIARALQLASRRQEVDVLLLVRGGGSLEDLWNFNEVTVAEAIRACPVPVVSGVGHEVDVTIADLVADLRAPTPSAAAELASPDGLALIQRAQNARELLQRAIELRLSRAEHGRVALTERLQARHPARALQERSQRTDELEARLIQALDRRLERHQGRLETLKLRLTRQAPDVRLARLAARLDGLWQRQRAAMSRRLEQHDHRLQVLSGTLHSVSPLATLSRGFAVVRHDGRIVRDAGNLEPGDRLTTRFAQGEVASIVDARLDDAHPGSKSADRA